MKQPSHRANAGIEHSYDQRVEAGHHRRENRQVWVVPVAALPDLYQPSPWAGLQSVVMVVRVRQLWNKTTREVQFYLSSLPCDAVRIGRAIRAHWGIENQLHARLGCHQWLRMLPGFAIVIVLKTSLSYVAWRLACDWQETSTKRSLRQKARTGGDGLQLHASGTRYCPISIA